jgi:hypothetical protein
LLLSFAISVSDENRRAALSAPGIGQAAIYRIDAELVAVDYRQDCNRGIARNMANELVDDAAPIEPEADSTAIRGEEDPCEPSPRSKKPDDFRAALLDLGLRHYGVLRTVGSDQMNLSTGMDVGQ